jgi:hypothetical protein
MRTSKIGHKRRGYQKEEVTKKINGIVCIICFIWGGLVDDMSFRNVEFYMQSIFVGISAWFCV